jgi:hypothetical protein
MPVPGWKVRSPMLIGVPFTVIAPIVAIKPPVSGLTWMSVLVPLVVLMVEAKRRPSGWNAIPVKPKPETGVPTTVPLPFI